MDCQYCNKTFSTKSSLNYHQRTARFCLSIQGKTIAKFICEYCNKPASTLQNSKQHYLICPKKQITEFTNNKDTEIAKLKLQLKFSKKELLYQKKELLYQKKESKKEFLNQKKEIEKLQNKLDVILLHAVDKPTTTNNNTVNVNRMQQISNLIPLTEQHFLEQAENLTIDHIKDGGAGYARLAVDYTLKDRSICADFSRKKLVYKEEDGTITSDPGLNKIAPVFFKSILDKHADVVCKYRAEQYKKFGIDTDCTDEEKKAYSDGEKLVVIGEVSELVSQGKRINSIAKGKDLDDKIMEDFRKVLCGLLSN